jgi:hypothetical protein
MKNTSIFSLIAAKGSQFTGTTSDGQNRVELALLGDVGYVKGSASNMRAIVLPGHTDADDWHLVNITDRHYLYLGTIAVLGATGEEHASDTALRSFNWAFGNIGQVYDVIPAPAYVLSRLLDHEGRAQYKGRVTHDELRKIHQQVTLTPVVWKGDDSTELASHSDYPSLSRDMCRADGVRALYDTATVDGICQVLFEGAETDQYDAIISQVSRMDGLSNRILVAMNQAADKVKPVKVTKTDPFKKNGVVNIAQIFELDDGQTVTIVYHNPDSTPTKLDPKDTVTSWKFLLNKRDVSAVLQPKSGKDVQIPVLAKRMMMVVEANSARFKRNQERQLKAENTLVELQKIEQEKQAELLQLDQEIEELQKQLDVPLENHVTGQVETAATFEAAVTRYNIKSLNKRARKPDGLVKFSTRADGEYDVHMEQGSVGGDYVGTIDGAKSWLEGRMQSLSDALDGQSSWDRIAARLVLVSGDDVLGLPAAAAPGTPAEPETKTTDVLKETITPEQADLNWGRQVSAMLRDAAENGRPKFTRNIDGLIALAKSLIEQNKTKGDIVVDELQYIVNQVRTMRQYNVVMPRNDRVTKGKTSNKIRRLNAVFKEAQTPFSMVYSKDDNTARIVSEDTQFHSVSFHFMSGVWSSPYKMGEYGPLLPAIEAYLNEDPTIEREQMLFGTNTNVVDTASGQLAWDLKKYLLEGVDQAKKDSAVYSENRKAGLDPTMARAAVELAKTIDPVLGAADEVNAATGDMTSPNPGMTPEPDSAITPEPQNPERGITPENEARLIQDLKRLNEDPEWGGNDRYSYFFKRIQRAVDGEDQEAIQWANNWIAELDQYKADKEATQKADADRVKENLANAPKTERHQLWEQAQALGDTTPYISWIPARSAEFIKENPEYTNMLGGTPASQEAYQTAFDAFLNKYVDALKTSQETNNTTQEDNGVTAAEPNPDETWLDQIIAGDLDLANLDMDQFMEVATKYAADTSTPIYAKLEQALNAVTAAKVAKAQGV